MQEVRVKWREWDDRRENRTILGGEKMSNLGQFIRTKRETAGLSLKKVAHLCGTTDTAIQRIETGKTKNPGWEQLCKIAKAVQIHPFEILKEFGYITDSDINPILRLNGLDALDDYELQLVQIYVDFMIFRKKDTRKSREELLACSTD